ncbi:holo-ACP synthase [Konateibacter massiliensis]|uniref:holo-ACP synthase n=1 Tax=Konateibacter massiliensis TaxID=2002841 RepID=UPI000C161E60|nr:holo-ACP synthase [Konateibacter massiliensis]
MIIGIGTDIIEVQRIKKACEKEAFFMRCFTERERELIGDNGVRAAGNFAVKEAVAKVFGTGFRGFKLTDIEVLRDELGKPYVNLYGNASKLAKKQGINKLHISISNTKDYAIAYVIGEAL